MTGIILAVVIVLMFIGLLTILLRTSRPAGRLYDAAREVDAAFHEARQAMNEAAGQSWRNLTG